MTAKQRKPKLKKHSSKSDEIQIVMIPVDQLIPHPSNPNVMGEDDLDLLVEEIQEHGFDEPLLVRDLEDGTYQIASGHHRKIAASRAGLEELPCVIKDWDEREVQAALVKRNLLRGDMDKTKFTKLWKDLTKGKDAALVQRELGITDKKALDRLIEDAGKSMTPKQRQKLDKAKEKIKSVDDLSSVLNTIFKESGSEIEEGYVVFSFGGKRHHYTQVDKETMEALETMAKQAGSAAAMKNHMQSIIKAAPLPDGVQSVTKETKKRRSRRVKRGSKG